MVFIYIIYKIFVNQDFSPKNPWAIVSYFFSLETENERVQDNSISKGSSEREVPASNTIEWSLTTPINSHAFEVLPVQS
jgi:hypothetical protein